MKYSFFLLLFTTIVFAADETETWICQGTAAGGLYWEVDKWKVGEFGTRIYKIELEGMQASISENNDPVLMLMQCESNTWSWSCSNDAASFEINKENHSAVIMRFFGAVSSAPNSNQKDSIYIEALHCEKF